jgi:hypothetical protein
MSNLLPATLIIPNNNNNLNLHDLLKSVIFWTKFPAEILISDNSDKKFKIDKKIVRILKKNKISIKVLYKKNNYPGSARNIAIKQAAFPNLVFLDTSTFCQIDWLEITYGLLGKKINVVFGQTNYLAYSYYSKLFRAATFGDKPLKTLPGSAIKKKVFSVTGLFLDYIRSGEDGYFFEMLKKNKVKTINSTSQIDYTNNLDFNFFKSLKKWYRNYYSSASLKHLNFQKKIYFFSFIFFFFTFAFLLKGEFLYLVFFFILYGLLRGIIIPLSKSKDNKSFIIINFIFILIISIGLDIAKFMGFAMFKIVKLFYQFKYKIS